MVELLTQLVANTQGINGSHGHNGNRVEGSNTHVPTWNHIGSTSRVTPRPHMPQFLEGQQAGNQGQQGQGEYFMEFLKEYQTLGEEFQAAMSLQDFCTIKYKNRPIDLNKGPPTKLGASEENWEVVHSLL
jgi:hypothetical protein